MSSADTGSTAAQGWYRWSEIWRFRTKRRSIDRKSERGLERRYPARGGLANPDIAEGELRERKTKASEQSKRVSAPVCTDIANRTLSGPGLYVIGASGGESELTAA
eukprot:3867358-Rhodomonas_salina.1